MKPQACFWPFYYPGGFAPFCFERVFYHPLGWLHQNGGFITSFWCSPKKAGDICSHNLHPLMGMAPRQQEMRSHNYTWRLGVVLRQQGYTAPPPLPQLTFTQHRGTALNYLSVPSGATTISLYCILVLHSEDSHRTEQLNCCNSKLSRNRTLSIHCCNCGKLLAVKLSAACIL